VILQGGATVPDCGDGSSDPESPEYCQVKKLAGKHLEWNRFS
jgi:hypothetical protein